MQSKAKDVDGYLKEIPKERKDVLKRLRNLCLTVLEDYTEGMFYGMPSYKHGESEPEVGFASQKQYISLYILKQDVLDQYRERLKKPGVSLGKGSVRFSKPERIDFDIVREMLEASKQSEGKIC